jgi:hypothetical protein
MRRQIALYLLAIALVALTGCGSIDSDASFYVMSTRNGERTTFVPQGWGWVPRSRIEISVLGEPRISDNEVLTDGGWRSLGFVTPDSNGQFGFNTGPFTSVVQKLCGFPPPWMAQPLFLARDTSTGKVRIFSGRTGDWFTFKACP